MQQNTLKIAELPLKIAILPDISKKAGKQR